MGKQGRVKSGRADRYVEPASDSGYRTAYSQTVGHHAAVVPEDSERCGRPGCRSIRGVSEESGARRRLDVGSERLAAPHFAFRIGRLFYLDLTDRRRVLNSLKLAITTVKIRNDRMMVK
jgi:hypothetical protein